MSFQQDKALKEVEVAPLIPGLPMVEKEVLPLTGLLLARQMKEAAISGPQTITGQRTLHQPLQQDQNTREITQITLSRPDIQALTRAPDHQPAHLKVREVLLAVDLYIVDKVYYEKNYNTRNRHYINNINDGAE